MAVRWILLFGLVLGGCKREVAPAASSSASSSRAPLAHASSSPSAAVSSARPATAESDEPAEARAPDAGVTSGPFIIDELADVGPAAPAAAATAGVVMLTRSDELLVAKLLPRLPNVDKPAKSALGTVTRDAAEFSPYARGPAVLDGHAYWVSKARLLRRRIEGGALEVLSPGARDGTRVSAARASGRAVAAFLAQGAAALVAKLWVEGHGLDDLTPEGAAANSVALVPSGADLLALSLEARTGMAPVHARRVRFGADGSPKLDPDVVVWVGSSAGSMTELVGLLSSSGEVAAFVPMPRDITHFGLARIDVGSTPELESDVAWRTYPNGLDPAPLAAASICGEPVVIYARPSEARPHAPQELHLAVLEAAGLGPSEVIARARAFADVSLAAIDRGALVAWVADRRSWAATLRCRVRRK